MSSAASGSGYDPEGFPQYLAQCIKIDIRSVPGAGLRGCLPAFAEHMNQFIRGAHAITDATHIDEVQGRNIVGSDSLSGQSAAEVMAGKSSVVAPMPPSAAGVFTSSLATGFFRANWRMTSSSRE